MKKSFAGFVSLALGCALAASCASAPAADTTAAAPSTQAAVAITQETAANLPGYNIYRPAAYSSTPLPVIAWANGGCVRRDQTWRTIFERWAAAGFFVITVDALPGADPAAPGRFTVDDQAAAIDWAVRENTLARGPYQNRLDLNRIVAAGNSCGGMTSLALAARDPRVKSVYILSGSSVGPNPQPGAAEAVMTRVTAPVIFIVGGQEDIARNPSNVDYGLLRAGIPSIVVGRNAGDHRTVSTDPNILPDVADIGVNWFRATLYNDAAATRALQTNLCERCDAATWSATRKNIG